MAKNDDEKAPHGAGDLGDRMDTSGEVHGEVAESDGDVVLVLRAALDAVAGFERNHRQWPRYHDGVISVDDFLYTLVAAVPDHLLPEVRKATAQFVSAAPVSVFLPTWMREQRF